MNIDEERHAVIGQLEIDVLYLGDILDNLNNLNLLLKGSEKPSLTALRQLKNNVMANGYAVFPIVPLTAFVESTPSNTQLLLHFL